MTRILLMDDNIDMVTMLRLVLEQRGYEVVWGRHGEDGLKLLNQSKHNPDLIMSNLLMPTPWCVPLALVREGPGSRARHAWPRARCRALCS